MNQSKSAVIASIVGLALIAAALYWWNPWARQASANGEKVRVGQVGEFFIYMPLYFANDKGFFEKEGLAVSIVNTGGDEKSVAAVISGDVMFGVGDPTFSPIAGLKGAKTRIVAGVLNGVPFWGLTYRKDIPIIAEPKQLNGYTVATFPSPSTAYTLQSQMFKDGGLEPKIRQAQFGTLLPTLKSGSADIALELEPNVSLAAREGGRVVYSLATRYPNFAITGVSVAEDTVQKKRSVVQRFVRALDAAVKFAHANPKVIEDFAVAKFKDLEPSVAREAIRRMLTDKVFPTTAKVSALAWENVLRLRVQSGEIKNIQDGLPYLDMSLFGN